ncbi:hypothetical protein FRB94_005903 [Tulasnella sp. JGI-2019a]|nr:hypothetical protein FRB94_005903 [Tulasnella sp. JGI-2019a]KAG9029073.1 hypothetical protein FRB95_005768 [Tulasnella sp. JGI-2019a]
MGWSATLTIVWNESLSVTQTVQLIWGILLLGAIQSILTVGIHCCELITTLARDERVWRAASSVNGARPDGNPLKVVLGSWQSMGLLLAKPLIHWVFGLAVSMEAGRGFVISGEFMSALGGGMIAIAAFVTFIGTRRPEGPQPAAFGHI